MMSSRLRSRPLNDYGLGVERAPDLTIYGMVIGGRGLLTRRVKKKTNCQKPKRARSDMAVQPSLAPLPFLREPKAMWEKCKELIDSWPSFTQGKYAEQMKSFKAKMVVKTLCYTNVLEDTLPENVTLPVAEEELTKAYENKNLSKVSTINNIYTTLLFCRHRLLRQRKVNLVVYSWSSILMPI